MKINYEKQIEDLKNVHQVEHGKLTFEKEKLMKVAESFNKIEVENLKADGESKEKSVEALKFNIHKECDEKLEQELLLQSVVFQEQLENTMKNLEANDRDRMEEMRNQCMKTMDVYHHLMACRQVTEMMQLLATQRKQNKQRKIETRNESIITAPSGEHSRLNQSKSIKYLWREFLARIDDYSDDAQLDSDERKIVDKIQQIRNDLDCMLEGVDEIFIISGQEGQQDWLHRTSDVDVCKITQRPIVEWEHTNNESDIPKGNSFTSLLFKHPQERRASEIPKITSSIIKMARGEPETNVDTDQNKLMKKLLLDASSPDVEIVPLPNPKAASIKDSVEVIHKHVS